MGTVKTYRATSEISINVNVGKNLSKHIRFDVLSNGGSEYKTSDKSIQKALENHSRYGELFNCVEMKKENVEQNNDKDEPKTVEINVSSIAEAKDYLVEQKGIERTKLKNKESILSAASSSGITFIGI